MIVLSGPPPGPPLVALLLSDAVSCPSYRLPVALGSLPVHTTDRRAVLLCVARCHMSVHRLRLSSCTTRRIRCPLSFASFAWRVLTQPVRRKASSVPSRILLTRATRLDRSRCVCSLARSLAFFECFPYVCPEPVLVNRCIFSVDSGRKAMRTDADGAVARCCR